MKMFPSARWAGFTVCAAVISLFVLVGCQMQITDSPVQPQGQVSLSASAQTAVPANPPAWDANTLYNKAGLYVTHKGKVWVSQWYITRGAEPGKNTWNGWKSAEVPSTDKSSPKPWSADAIYNAKGYYVTHNGGLWVSQWSITRGAEPGKNTWNGWKDISPPKWSRTSTGMHHTTAINSLGQLYAWGSSRQGQLGTGKKTNEKRPVRIGTASNWESVSSSRFYNLAINKDGELYGWGDNTEGQLGNGTRTDQTRPVRIGASSNWSQVSAGGVHSLAINEDGHLYAWGDNSAGQLGKRLSRRIHYPQSE